MSRQSLVTVSALAVLLIAGLSTGCDKKAEESATSSAKTSTSESVEANDKAADKGAMAHDMNDMKMEGDNKHDMNMQAGEDLHGNFAHKELVVLDDPVEVPAEFTTALGQMHQHYRDMAQAFVADDAEAADAAAQKMREQVENLSVDGLDTEAKDAWQSHRKVMRTRLHQLTSAEEIESKREHFSHISEAMYCALKSFGGISQEVHVSFCPMALDGHGAYWLADKPEIENPYMGQKMASCGEVKETI
jgi:hypothetical protein